MPQLWVNFEQRRQALLTNVRDRLAVNLGNRPVQGRDEAGDDLMFQPLTERTTGALNRGEYQLAIRMYRQSMQQVAEYEQNTPGSVLHKGLPAFNVGLAHLRAYDFVAAMQYFELAQREMRRTTGGDGWNIFSGPVFEAHYWDVIEGGSNTYPIPLYEEFWGHRFSKATAKANWQRLSKHSKLGYIFANAERIRLRQLVDQSGMNDSRSLALAYWNLIGELSRLLETEVNRRAKPPAGGWPTGNRPDMLHGILHDGYTNTRIGNISAAFHGIHHARSMRGTDRYNMHFNTVRDRILNAGLPRADRIYDALYLLYATRNQVQHKVDRNLRIYRSIPAAIFATEVLITLCRLDSWTRD
jgi:hypothetical protein